jgi:hypothetical protein
LPGLVGSNHQAFMAMKDSCKEKREQLTESNRQLHVHLSAHGCWLARVYQEASKGVIKTGNFFSSANPEVWDVVASPLK